VLSRPLSLLSRPTLCVLLVFTFSLTGTIARAPCPVFFGPQFLQSRLISGRFDKLAAVSLLFPVTITGLPPNSGVAWTSLT